MQARRRREDDRIDVVALKHGVQPDDGVRHAVLCGDGIRLRLRGRADDRDLGIVAVLQSVEVLHAERAGGADDGDAHLLAGLAHAGTSDSRASASVSGASLSAASTRASAASAAEVSPTRAGFEMTRCPTAVLDAGTW